MSALTQALGTSPLIEALEALEIERQALNTTARGRLMKNVSVTLNVEFMTGQRQIKVSIWSDKQKLLHQNRYLKTFKDAHKWIESHA